MKTLKVLSKVISDVLGIIGILALALGIILFFASSEPFGKVTFFCFMTCFVCFGYIWLSEKIHRKKLSPEERATEDEEKRNQEKIIESLKYNSGAYTYNSWIFKQVNEEYSKKTNDIIYKKIDEMVEQAEDTEMKIMLLKKKNKMLQEDLAKLEENFRDRN